MLKDIIFFNDFGLYSQCELEATKRGQKMAQFQVDCVVAYFAKQKQDVKIRNNRDLFIVCQKEVEKGSADSAAEFIEKCCAEEIGLTYKPKTPRKLGAFELPKG